MSHPKRILYPPPSDVQPGKPSGPVSAGDSQAKKCLECRMIRPISSYGHSRGNKDGLKLQCRDCTNQSKRISQFNKYGKLKPRPDEDSYLRNNLHQNRNLLAEFFHGTDVSMPGFAYSISDCLDYTFTLRRVPNTSLVEMVLYDTAGQHLIYGCDRLKKDAIQDLCAVLREYRLESTAMAMHMAKLYIYNQP